MQSPIKKPITLICIVLVSFGPRFTKGDNHWKGDQCGKSRFNGSESLLVQLSPSNSELQHLK